MDSSSFFQVKIIFILLNMVNLLVMWKVGYRLTKIKENRLYWKNAIWIILSYSVIMGLRFGRMIDYNVYYDRYAEIGNHFERVNYEITFKCICWGLYNIGIPYQGFIWLLSVLLIISVLYLVKDYRKYAPYICILFLWEAHNAELLIRWYLAFTFYLFAFVNYKNNSYLKACVFSFLSATTHIGLLLVIIFTLGISVLKKKILPSYVVEILFLLSLFMGAVGILKFLNPYISFLGIDERSAHYAESFDKIISGEYGILGFTKERSISNFIRIVLAYSFPILFLSKLLKEKLVSIVEANLFLIGTMVFPILAQVEILNRFGESLIFFSIIVSSISYQYVLTHKKELPFGIYIFSWVSMISNYWPVISTIINREYWWQMLFIWDAGSRNTLPLQLFIDHY